MVNRLHILGILALFFLSSQAWAEEKIARLRVGLDSDYPPFSFLNERGSHSGFDLDVAKALCESMACRCEFVYQPFDGLLETLRRGEIDLLMGVSDTAARRPYMDFSVPYFHARSIYIGRPGVLNLDSEAAMRVGVRAGTVQMIYVENYQPRRTTIIREQFGRLLDMLCRGDLDMILANDLAAYIFLLSERGQEFDVLGEPLPLESFPSDVRVGVRKGAGKLRENVDMAIKNIRMDGTFGRINQDYFPYTLY